MKYQVCQLEEVDYHVFETFVVATFDTYEQAVEYSTFMVDSFIREIED